MLKILLSPVRALILFFKLAGVKGGFLFLLGVAVGLLLAPETGAELRLRLRSMAAGSDPGLPADADLTL